MIRISTRDRKVIDYLLIHRAERKSRLKKEFYSGIGKRAFNFQMRRLRINLSEIIDETYVDFSEEGVMIAKPVPGVIGTYPAHDLRVSDIVNTFSRVLKGELLSIFREYQIRTHGVLNHHTKQSYFYAKIPDAVIQWKGELLSIELENSQKSYNRIYESVQKFESNRYTNVEHTLVFCVSSHIYKAYQKAIEEYSLRARKNPEHLRTIVVDASYMTTKEPYSEKLIEDIREIVRNLRGETN